MNEDATLRLGAWSEVQFERGAFGSDDREGFVVAARLEDDRIEVLPVRYRREDGTERVRALTEDWEASRRDPSVPIPDVAERTAFATRLTYTPFDTEREEVVCVAADAGDALAVAAWLAESSADAGALRRHVNVHAASGSPTGAALSDDDVLAASFADAADRCVFTASETRSHHVELPYRYVPLLSAARKTRAGVPRFPSTVRGVQGAVSHAAWEERGLDAVDFDVSLERSAAGEYPLDADVVDAVAGSDAESYRLLRLGAEA